MELWSLQTTPQTSDFRFDQPTMPKVFPRVNRSVRFIRIMAAACPSGHRGWVISELILQFTWGRVSSWSISSCQRRIADGFLVVWPRLAPPFTDRCSSMEPGELNRHRASLMQRNFAWLNSALVSAIYSNLPVHLCKPRSLPALH